MIQRRRWLPAAGLSAATGAAALATYLVLGAHPTAASGPTGSARAAASAPPPAPRPEVVAPGRPSAQQRRLAETPRDQLRPDAPLAASSAPLPARLAPVRLRVPRVGVDTGLLRLTRLADGTLQVPGSADRAGWYTGGPAPGQVGPAVLAGHVDSATAPGVFYRLRELRAGDEIHIGRGDGRQLRFTVTGAERVAKAAFPTARVYGPTPFAELRLVTCGGSFDAARGHYRDNVVVYASLVGDPEPSTVLRG